MTTTEHLSVAEPDVLHRLSLLDRFLPVWIGAAMVLGLLLGAAIPQLDDWLDTVKVGTVSLPIAIGLLLMMYPVLAKVRYRRLDEAISDRRSMTVSLVLNWVVGPALMFALAWLFLSDLPEYRTGLIIVGLARCIAMVLIWNDLACGDRELAAVLVAINSLFQIVAFSVLGWFYLELLPGWLGLDTEALDVSMWEIAKVVLVFLGIPLAAGFLTRLIGERTKGTEWYEQRFLPRIGPVALYGLLFTIVVLFALQGDNITSEPWDVARIALPLLAYFAIMWFGSFFARAATRVPVRAQHVDRVHGRGEQLRARDRRRDRCVRRDLGRSARRCRRPADRGARAGRARLCRAVGPAPLLPDVGTPSQPRGGIMNCFDCALVGAVTSAVACLPRLRRWGVLGACRRPRASSHSYRDDQPDDRGRTPGSSHQMRDLYGSARCRSPGCCAEAPTRRTACQPLTTVAPHPVSRYEQPAGVVAHPQLSLLCR